MTSNNPIKVLVTGAAGQIASSIIPLICNGLVFGPDQKVIIHMLEITPCLCKLKGIEMEIEDGNYRLVEGILSTDSLDEAVKDIDWAILIGGFSVRGTWKNFERDSLLEGNVPIFSDMGKSLEKHAKKTVKVVVVANPANTNALIVSKYAPSIPKTNISSLSRLDYNRATTVLARKLHVSNESVKNVSIWGNHSRTLIGDVSHASVNSKNLATELNDEAYLKNDFNEFLRSRFYAVVEAKGATASISAANATKDHIHDLIFGIPDGVHVAMGVLSDGNPYGVKEGIFFSFPVTTKNGEWKFFEGFHFSADMKLMIEATEKELLSEKEKAESFCN